MMPHILPSDNHLFTLASPGRLRWPRSISPKLYAVAALLFGLLAIPIAQIIGVIPLILIAGFDRIITGQAAILLPFGPNTNAALWLIALFAPIYLLVWGWVRFFERRPFWTIGFERPGWLAKYGRGLLLGLLMFSATVGVSALPGFIAFESGGLQPSGLPMLGGVLIVFLGWVVQGAAEEVLVRGFWLPIIGLRFGPLASILSSSLAFAALHLLNANLSLLALLNLFLFGVFAALYALYEGGLWGICAIHSVWNWAQGNLYGLQVSGMDIHSATLLDLQEIGPDWLTGGPFGPEGGLGASLVLVISIILLGIAHAQRR